MPADRDGVPASPEGGASPVHMPRLDEMRHMTREERAAFDAITRSMVRPLTCQHCGQPVRATTAKPAEPAQPATREAPEAKPAPPLSAETLHALVDAYGAAMLRYGQIGPHSAKGQAAWREVLDTCAALLAAVERSEAERLRLEADNRRARSILAGLSDDLDESKRDVERLTRERDEAQRDARNFVALNDELIAHFDHLTAQIRAAERFARAWKAKARQLREQYKLADEFATRMDRLVVAERAARTTAEAERDAERAHHAAAQHDIEQLIRERDRTRRSAEGAGGAERDSGATRT